MKTASLKICGALAALMLAGLHAHADVYKVAVTNGGLMPLSPGVIYVTNGQLALSRVGQAPTGGFAEICRSGMTMTRQQELMRDSQVTFSTATSAPILPGETREVEVTVNDPLQQSVHVEFMYGKTKDTCSVASISSHQLYALKQHVTSDVVLRDQAVQSGAFEDPALPMGRNHLDTSVCANEKDAVSCLRTLSPMARQTPRIRFFSPYLSSVSMLLENKYGAADVQTLSLSPAGAVQVQVKLKH